MLSVGIIGLPNVGKSTLFNALTSGSAAVSNYPFTTIDSNVGVVAVPDPRLDLLASTLKPEETHPTAVQFIDIAGLVRGANRGEGLGNQFLGNIREVDAVAHVVRCFRQPDVAHVEGEVDPARDIDVVETELLLADLEILDRAIEKRSNTWKTSPRQHAPEEARYRHYRQCLATGVPLRQLTLHEDEQRELKSLGILTGKPCFYIANVSESDLPDPEGLWRKRIGQSRLVVNPVVIALSARLEWELGQLEPDERAEFMSYLGLRKSGLDQLIRAAFEALGLITFYTVANNKLSAWAVKSGVTAPVAAGKIHTDMERGFIRAQVTTFDHFSQHPNMQALHRLGQVKTEGREYVVRDGDIIEFLFSPS